MEEAKLCCPGSQVVCGQLAARKEAASIPNWSVATDAEKVGRSCEDAFAHLLAGWTDRNMTAYLAKRVSRIARLSEARKLRRE